MRTLIPGLRTPSSARRLITATLIAVVALLGAACHSSPPAGVGVPSLPPTATALPTFDYASFQELLAQLKGKPVVVNIWASWCGPCLREAPELAKVSRAHAGSVQFVGVDILDQRPPAVAFIRKFGWTYPSVFDPNGSIRDGLGLLGQPDTIVFDSTGKQVWQFPGPVSADQLEAQLAAMG